MLTITLHTDQRTTAAYCRKYGLIWSEAFYLYIAENRGETFAAGLFEVGGDSVRAAGYEAADPSDSVLFDGILRAGMNYAAGQGIENGLISEEFRARHHNLFAKLHYPAQPLFNITNFFQKYKNCGGVGRL